MTQINFTINMEELIEQVMGSNLSGLIKSQLTMMINHTMEYERDQYIKAKHYERTTGRVDYRNGYYKREFVTNIGRMTLTVPRTRSGEFSTAVFEKYKRMDQALVLTIIEAYINGVSTRKVTKVVEALVGESVSKSLVSSLVAKIDPDIKAFRHRPLTPAFPYLYADALYVKVRENQKIVSKAVYIAQGVREDGFRELVGFKVADVESEHNWRDFFSELKERGLATPKMVISDAHKGLVLAVQKELTGAIWQRCAVHFMRNIVTRMPKKDTVQAREILKSIFKSSTLSLARERRDALFQLVGTDKRFADALRVLEEGFDDATQFLNEPEAYHCSLKSTNSLDRLNRNLRSREQVISIFPNTESVTRLFGAVLMDIQEEFQKPKRRLLRVVPLLDS